MQVFDLVAQEVQELHVSLQKVKERRVIVCFKTFGNKHSTSLVGFF